MQLQRSRAIDLPDGLTSSRSKLVYLYLRVRGAATVDELKTELDMQLLTLYGILRRLRETNLVRKSDGRWLVEES